uniref:Uncharacterized protein n=1 Tax=Ditylenchus dipsaci TaxID=166011 RepID=A0A915E942_9BILA
MTKQRTTPWFAFFLNCSCSVLLLIGQFDELIGWKRIVAVHGFEVLPFVHIDYGHYLRLAECQAKCSQKYGLMTDRVLLDGSFRPYCNTSAELHEICEMGCSIHLKSPAFTSNKLVRMVLYWKLFKMDNLIGGVHLLLLMLNTTKNKTNNPATYLPLKKSLGSGKRRSLMSASRASAALFDTFEAILTADLKEEFKFNKSFSQYKYIVQWRQKQAESEESKEERQSGSLLRSSLATLLK